jgi:hypothetical protein
MTGTVLPPADVASADLSSTVDIGIVTIRDDEFRAVLAGLSRKDRQPPAGQPRVHAAAR